MSAASAAAEPALCVDLDGTLIVGDALRSALRELALTRPWMYPGALAALVRGRPGLKRFVHRRVRFDPGNCSWCRPVVDFVREEHERGRRVVLATAADSSVASAVAGYLGVFDDVLATEPGRNMKGPVKRDAIRKLLHDNEFDYVGDSRADVPIFAAARWSYLVAPSDGLLAATRRVARVKAVFPCRQTT